MLTLTCHDLIDLLQALEGKTDSEVTGLCGSGQYELGYSNLDI